MKLHVAVGIGCSPSSLSPFSFLFFFRQPSPAQYMKQGAPTEKLEESGDDCLLLSSWRGSRASGRGRATRKSGQSSSVEIPRQGGRVPLQSGAPGVRGGLGILAQVWTFTLSAMYPNFPQVVRTCYDSLVNSPPRPRVK